ncbi:hypothetical protein AGABI1DRAFT_36737 [Agaricus bisporus var. burnettii JB137-S8]|uniref:Uncharacterized protein n=1 Tax=Agaricus bisporus var. burnettii (strain JB137-S8 / ATCC MYA-4627 / FGSC 10392) TaxID=597362 RepID=K5XZQ6_AGABU|nr:uncharacterized protein AGABI1DRAFT_36737 [Agaricus bisporus var. burnettii JB137-S8]EKM80945.1 hypothetical protein AGABI1DRAFT_36737 [Agaricus bisporus var. burnettii JB137-S8]
MTSVKERRVWYRQLKRKTPSQKAKKSALVVRSLLTDPPTVAGPRATKVIALDQLKSQLIKPKTANSIIAELRKLPVAGSGSSREADHRIPPVSVAPIHAVCLEHTDAKEDELYFSKFAASVDYNGSPDIASMLQFDSISLDKFAQWLNEIHVIDLISTPDLGLGQPGDGPGILAGAVPTPETVLKGIEQITPQLMALCYAAGKSIAPDHTGIFPPTDRISVLTYWWGLEVLLPPPTLGYLSRTQSIAGAVMNFLTALSLVNNGVREILPIARYISRFIDFEFDQIKRQDKGKGVVCAATWVMPAALVPRPWDFSDPPTSSANPVKDEDNLSDPSH